MAAMKMDGSVRKPRRSKAVTAWSYGKPKAQFLADCAKMLDTAAGQAMFAVHPTVMLETIETAIGEYTPVKKPNILAAKFVEEVRRYLSNRPSQSTVTVKDHINLIVARAKKLQAIIEAPPLRLKPRIEQRRRDDA